MESKILAAKDIVKRYGDKEVLHGVSLELRPHTIYGLIGRNGAGKTTLMGIMTAQNTATSGSVTYGGEPVWENRHALADICFSREQNPNLLMGRNTYKVKHILQMASYYYPHWDQEYAQKLVQEFGLDVKKQICKLSSGMRSMVTILIALASKAPITFLDEPVAGLDVVARDQFYHLLLEEYQETERTFVVSTHIIEEAASVFEKVIFLDKGSILTMQDTDVLLSHYHYLSGRDDIVKEAAGTYPILHEERMGRSMTACVEAPAGALDARCRELDVSLDPVPLQKLFIYLAGHEQEED